MSRHKSKTRHWDIRVSDDFIEWVNSLIKELGLDPNKSELVHISVREYLVKQREKSLGIDPKSIERLIKFVATRQIETDIATVINTAINDYIDRHS